RFVVFTSYATDLVENYRAGEQGLFVRDMLAGTTTLIVSGVPDSTIIINGKNPLGLELQADQVEVQDYQPIISANGRFLAFSCYSDLVFPPPNGHIRDLYTGTTSAVRPESGFATKGYLRDLYTGTTSAVRIEVNRLAAEGTIRGISADGRFVLWTKDIPINIVQPFSFGTHPFNLYVRDMLKQEAKLVTISPDRKSDARNSDGNAAVVHDAAISADGRFVAFVTNAIN